MDDHQRIRLGLLSLAQEHALQRWDRRREASQENLGEPPTEAEILASAESYYQFVMKAQ